MQSVYGCCTTHPCFSVNSVHSTTVLYIRVYVHCSSFPFNPVHTITLCFLCAQQQSVRLVLAEAVIVVQVGGEGSGAGRLHSLAQVGGGYAWRCGPIARFKSGRQRERTEDG